VAGDLIPPPSPAGRPPPDTFEGTPPAATPLDAGPEPPEQQAPEPHGPAPFRGRFGFVWGALAGIALCAAALTAVLIAAPGDEGPQLAENWSSWEPSTSRMVDGAEDIAAHVGLQYRLADGGQLTQVRSSDLQFQGAPLGVAVRPRGAEEQLLEGDGVLYVLNGLGPNGAVAGGKPTRARGRLVFREALELALYSFRYLDDVTMVAVLLPPAASGNDPASSSASPQTRAIFYRPGDLLDQLRVPLDRTLSPHTPRPDTMRRAEAMRVDALTLRNLFLASVQPLKQNQNYLLLQEPDTVQ
jgi:hypothetical protein